MNKQISARNIMIFVSSMLLVACGSSFPKNDSIKKYNPSAGYRFDLLEQDDSGKKFNELFVILVFSGGGTRAAALSYGVLEALRDTTIQWQNQKVSLLDEVDVISSISGGSFPAAYYALYGSRIFNEFPDRFLYRPVQSDLLKLLLNPINLLKLAGPSFGRSDLAAEFYDREIFDSATYSDVIANNRRPFVILNATDMTIGAQFQFIQDQFDLLCSDLASVSLGRAVAASSAFPGILLTPLTFQNYANTCEYKQPGWVEFAISDHMSRLNINRIIRAENRLSYTATGQASRNYIHLTDGGVADNIGLRGPLSAISSTDNSWSVLRMIKKIDKLVVIVVNAATSPKIDRDKTPNVPGFIDTVTTAANVPLDNYSVDTLNHLSKTVDEFNMEAHLISACEEAALKKGPQCVPDFPKASHIELFPIEVAFEYIQNEKERDWFKSRPTTLELPRETVDKLRVIGRQLLSEDPKFKKLMKSLDGCLAMDGQGC